MKKVMIMDLWLAIVSWCVFLNGHPVAAVLTVFAAAVLAMLLTKVRQVRMGIVATVMFLLAYFFYLRSSVSLFFPELKVFLAASMINAAVMNECLHHVRRDFVLSLMLACLSGLLACCLAVFIVPERGYVLIGKGSLYLIVCFIFLPYLLPFLFHFCRKGVFVQYKKRNARAFLSES